VTLRLLLAFHAVVTFAAGVVLVAAPEAIPSAVGLHIGKEAYMVSYLLAAMEFGVAALSWGARSITDAHALRVIVTALIVVHATSGLLEAYAFIAGGIGGTIWANVAFRLVIIALFANYGLRSADSPPPARARSAPQD
jgi:hypothetical protein